MAWTTPKTNWAALDVVTAAELNKVGANCNYLKGGDGAFANDAAEISKFVTLTYGAAVDINAALGNVFMLTITNTTAFTINAPTNSAAGEIITIVLRNNAGATSGTITWNSNFLNSGSLPTSLANNNYWACSFVYLGTPAYWLRTDATAV